MAYHIVDGGAHAFGKSLKVQGGGDGMISGSLFIDPLIDLRRGDSGSDPLGSHIIQDSDIDFRAFPDGLDLGGGLDHVPGWDHMALTAVLSDLLVKIIVTFFIL